MASVEGGAGIVGNDLEQTIRKLVAQQLDVDAAQVTMEARFLDDLGADSLDLVELVMSIEEEFDIEIPDEEAEKLATVGDAVAYVKKKKE